MQSYYWRSLPRRRHRGFRQGIGGSYNSHVDSSRRKFHSEGRAVIRYFEKKLGDRLKGLRFLFIGMPDNNTTGDVRLYYTVDRENKTILMHGSLIMRAKVLHVDDEEHRRLFIDHCMYRAVCDYLDEDPRYLIPDVFNHF